MAFALLCTRFSIAGIFLHAAISKIRNMRDFRLAVGNYQILPRALVPPVALCLPFAEGAGAALLAVGILVTPVAALLALLLVGFALAMGVNLARGRVFDCGCAGTAPQRITWAHVSSNMTLAALAAVIAVAPTTALVIGAGSSGLFRVPAQGSDALPAVLVILLGMAIAAVVRKAMMIGRLRSALPGRANDHRDHADAGSL